MLDKNRYYKLYQSRVGTDGPLAAVAAVDSLLIAKVQAEAEVASEEVAELAEYLKNELFTASPEHYRGMMAMWGREPYTLRYAGVSVPAPDVTENYPLGAEPPAGFVDDDFFAEYLDHDTTDDDLRYGNAYDLAVRLWELPGTKTVSFSSPEYSYPQPFSATIPEGASLANHPSMLGATIDFLCAFMEQKEGRLTVTTEPEHDLYCFVSKDGTDWVSKEAEDRTAYQEFHYKVMKR